MTAPLRMITGGLAEPPDDEHSLVPPNDEPAEHAVIASMLVDESLCSEALSLLRPEHFFGRKFRTAFEAMAAMRAASERIDSVTLLSHLRERGRLGELGPDGVPGLLDGVAAVGAVGSYARAIRDAWRMRQLLTECQRWTAEAYQGAGEQPAQGLLERVVARATELAGDSPAFTAHTSAELAGEAWKYLEAQAKNAASRGTAGVPTGLRDLDRITTGLHAPDLVLVGALPSMGKSALLSAVAIGAAEAGIGVAFFSLEMPARDILLRAVGARAGVSMADLRAGNYRARISAIVEATKHIAALPIMWDGVSSGDPGAAIPTVVELLAKAERAASAARSKRQAPIGLVIIDYLQRIRPTPGRGYRSREECVAENAKGLKLMASRLGVPVVCAAALNRQSVADDRKPEMRDLRESGAAEFEADGIWLLHREDYKHERKQSSDYRFTGEAEVIIAKSRNGATGSVMLGFDREFTRFRDLAEEQPRSWHDQADY